MKKFILILLTLSLILVPVFSTEVKAEAIDPVKAGGVYAPLSLQFAPLSIRSLGMGGAGVTVAKGVEGIYQNPASLAEGKFSLSLPSVGITLYNAKEILSEETMAAIQSAGENMGDAASTVLNIFLSKGKNEILTSDIALGFTAGGSKKWGLGLSANVQERVLSFSDGVNLSSLNLVADINAAATFGFGIRFKIGEKFSLDAGISATFNYRAFNKAIDANTALGMFGGGDGSGDAMSQIMLETPLMAGFSVPIQAAVTANIPLGFKASVVVRNINGTFYMKAYPGINDFTSQVLKMSFAETPADREAVIDTYKYNTPVTLDASIGWHPDLSFKGLLDPAIAIDFVDIVGLSKETKDGAKFGEALLSHLKMGLDLRLLSVLNVRAGLDAGYVTLGAGLDLYVLKVEAAYYHHEFGLRIGDKPVDAVSIRINIGWDR